MKAESENIQKLFKHEYSKMVAVISGKYGLEHIELAEDIVSETFLLAAEDWPVNGIPPNPAGWLYTVAKQKTLYYFRRNKIFKDKVIPALRENHEGHSKDSEEIDFSTQSIKDSQLRMIFAVCSPAIASEAQIGLALKILCGFGIEEIAEAFLSNKETINKRLYRAKEKLRRSGIKLEFPAENEIVPRLDNVLRVIYLLFNEGYYSKTQNFILQKDLCLEAMRLCLLLTENENTDLPETNALLALMCFHSSRFDARQSEENYMILYGEQDEDLWDRDLINRGIFYLNRSMTGKIISSYHLEAKIAYWHCMKNDTMEKWEDILKLYDQLMIINYSHSVFLNRAFAIYKLKGAGQALEEVEKLKLENNHFYFLLLGELYENIDKEKSKNNFQLARSLAKTDTEKAAIQRRIKKS